MIFGKFILRRQLQKAGSDKSEAKDLYRVASQLADVVPHINQAAKQDIARQIGFKPAHLRRQHRLELAGAFVFALLVTLFSQTASPGSPLYALKRGSEEVIIRVSPSFKNDLVDRRKSELEELKKEKSQQDEIKRAEDDYKKSLDRSGRNAEEDSGKRGNDKSRSESHSGSGSDSKVFDSSESLQRGTFNSGSGSFGSSGRDHSEDD